MDFPTKNQQPEEDSLLQQSVDALNRHSDDCDPLWAPFSALITAHRGICDEINDLRKRDLVQQQHLAQCNEHKIQLEAEIEALARVDGLTDVWNYRHFREVLDTEWRRAMRNGSLLSVIMLDIDNLRHFNDAYGYIAGDLCLKRVGAFVARVFKRPADMVARYGGEEFVCVAPDTDQAGVKVLAEKMLAGVRALDIPHDHSDVAEVVTVSIGAATCVPVKQFKPFDLVEQAEVQLRHAKQAGRNQASTAKGLSA